MMAAMWVCLALVRCAPTGLAAGKGGSAAGAMELLLVLLGWAERGEGAEVSGRGAQPCMMAGGWRAVVTRAVAGNTAI
eukprot:scaffold14090_cov106-Isochrysis_galbana.AAC.2